MRQGGRQVISEEWKIQMLAKWSVPVTGVKPTSAEYGDKKANGGSRRSYLCNDSEG